MASGNAGLLKWVTLFDKNNEDKNSDRIAIPDIPDDELDLPEPGRRSRGGKKSRLSVERIYQKKTQLEHILLRPDTYIGSVERVSQPMWVYDDLNNVMVQREISYVPGLYKIFDEILVNASDNKQRDAKMNCIKIDIDPDTNMIKIWNNGKGIPVVEHKTEKMYVPTLIFGVLLTSSNYDDAQKKVTGGRNGYGAKLCNVFSTKFVVETQSNDERKAFRQTWTDNMGKTGEPKLTAARGEDYTCVTFHPDLQKFKMEKLDKDIVDLFTRRAYDIAASSKGVKVFLNGKRIPIKNFKEYIELYIKDKVDDNGQPVKLVHEIASARWEVGIALSEKGFQQASFVNSIATTKGGRHVDYITDQIVNKLIDVVKKKEKKGGINIKPFQVKNHLWVFVNALIENPTFDSQTKENMTLQMKSFGSKCVLSDKFINMASRCGIVEAIQSWMKFKAQAQLNKKSGAKTSKLKGIPKLDDANDAGTKHSIDCTLILTEGDSAKALAVAGLSIVGRDRYGVFPLKGKVLNVREATHKQIMENAEINNMIKIVGLRYKEKYENIESMKTLRYGKIMIMTDQDQDGSHIKGLLINFVHHNWPNLLKHGFLEEFITPIVKVSKNKQEKSFYSLPEFEEWKRETDNWHTYKVKYYKGLGTSTSKEAKEYFSEMTRNRIPFQYNGADDDACILLAFSKKKIEERKEWLTNWMEERKRRAQLGLPELYLYGKETKSITYNEFVNRELILFSNMDNERSIPSLVDGLKPGQRKVMFTCFKRNLTKELKVAQLAGSVAEMSAYHHGEMSLMSTIVGLAQNFVGSNNINLLQPIGQFGTRLHGGKDAASPRYIFTALSPVARHLFNVHDDPLLNGLYDDNQRIEPEYYMPIIPMVLVNGAEGIGTGWSTKIPNHDPREVVANLIRMLDGLEPRPMMPAYKGFKGLIEDIDGSRFAVSGEVSVLSDNTIEITELPVKTWTQTYKEGTLELMLAGTDKTPSLITDYKEYHTDATVRFVIKMNPDKLASSEDSGLHRVFKLQSGISTTSMVLFDSNGCIKRYDCVLEIFKEFYHVRLDFYQRRKDYLEGMLGAESLKLDNQARFICEKIDNIISIENKPKKELIQMLVRRGYESDPVKAWKIQQEKLMNLGRDDGDDDDDEEDRSGPDFNYILGMALWCLTKEKKEQLLKQRDDKAEELYQLRKKTKEDLWRDDLDAFLKELDVVEERERLEAEGVVSVVSKTMKGRTQKKKILALETKPSPVGRRIEPRIDSTMRAKAEAAAKARKKKALKKEAGPDGDLFDGIEDEDDDPTQRSLSERLDGADIMKPAAAKKAPTKRAPKSQSPVKRETKEPGLGRKKKGKNPWSDSEDDEDVNVSDEDLESSFQEVSPRERAAPRRAAATKAKYTFSDDENDKPTFSNNDDDKASSNGKGTLANGNNTSSPPQASPPRKMNFSDSESDSAPLPVQSRNRPKSPIFSVDSDDEPVFVPKAQAKPAEPAKPTKAAKKEAPPKKKAAPKRRKKMSDISDISDDDMPAKKPAPKKKAREDDFGAKKAAPKKRAKKVESDEDNWDAIMAAGPKKSTAAKAAAPVSSDDDDDFNPRARGGGGRSRKPVKYNFGGDSDDSDFN